LTRIGARLDAAPWQRLHTTILLALGAGWLFDSFEVQMFSSAVGPLGDHFGASTFERDAVLAVWLGGILLGAISGGRLTDLFGRRRLFVITCCGMPGSPFSPGSPPRSGSSTSCGSCPRWAWARSTRSSTPPSPSFMPARVRGKANALVMNFWPAGAVAAGVLAYLALDTLALSASTSWRWMFILGGLIALVVLYFRRRIPESPRWLAARGRYDEAERIVGSFGAPEASPSVPDTTPPGGLPAFVELVRHYPGRLALGALLDLAEAFGYYGIFALLSVVVLPQVHISQASIPIFYIIGNVGALAGGLIMASVFDRVGHRRMVGICYTLASAGVAVLAAATASGSAVWVTLAFVVASGFGTAAWTSAYPTFTELFPTHLRGAGVGTSVAVGRIGAIVGTLALPDLATRLGATASYLIVAACWLVGAAAVAVYALRGGAEGARRPLELLTPALAEA
jgi:MFS family permease